MRKSRNFLFTILFYTVASAATNQSEINNPSVNFPTMESISVTIGGSFYITGTFPASPVERVDQFITRIIANFKIQKNQPENKAFSQRNIILTRSTGEKIVVDLLKFQVTSDFSYNPYLKNEDVLFIPQNNLDLNFLSIEGAVNAPQKFPYSPGDHLADAILLAQGINPAFENVTTAIINRLDLEGNSENEDTVLISNNPVLHRCDRITIIADNSQRKDYKIFIDGEINHPGYVFITKNSTTLRKVIEKCGGIKPSADLNRAELIRGANVFRSALFTEDFESLMMARMSKISIDDSMAFSIDNKLRFLRGNGAINFNKVFDKNSSDGDFIVYNGDFIIIPEKVDLVYVFGQVNSPGYVPFLPDKSINYYIQKAGGIGITAKHETYLIKGKTRSWVDISRQDTTVSIESGDYIWIPKKPIHQLSYYLQQVGFMATIVSSVATLILLFIQIGKM